MFTPDPKKAQEPLHISPGMVVTLFFTANAIASAAMESQKGAPRGDRMILLAKALRWKASKEVKVEFNRDVTKADAPAKFFPDTQGEFSITPGIERVSFHAPQQGLTTIFFEVA